MSSDDDEVRASFTFYPSDTRALRRLNLALRDQGLDVARTDTFRALIHVTSEVDMFAMAALRLREEANAPASDDVVEERFTVRLRRGWIKKLDRVVDDLARKDLDVERTFVARSILHANHDVKAFTRAARKFLEDFPDKRFRAVRTKRRG